MDTQLLFNMHLLDLGLGMNRIGGMPFFFNIPYSSNSTCLLYRRLIFFRKIELSALFLYLFLTLTFALVLVVN